MVLGVELPVWHLSRPFIFLSSKVALDPGNSHLVVTKVMGLQKAGVERTGLQAREKAGLPPPLQDLGPASAHTTCSKDNAFSSSF